MRARILTLTLVAVSAAAVVMAAGSNPSSARKAALNDCKSCKERRATLDPKQFSDLRMYEAEVARSYEVARRMPATLDRIHCFCECQESSRFQHKTLLTCFTDEHAAGCGICIKEALLAADLKAKGAADEEIETLVEASFKTDGHAPTHDHRR